MIDSYRFGNMVIAGTAYPNDLIILPDGVIHHPWWRQSGHRLVIGDLDPVLTSGTVLLVIGTGKPGRMRPDPDLKKALAEHGIRVTAMPTTRAVAEYNAQIRYHTGVAGCFHLTC